MLDFSKAFDKVSHVKLVHKVSLVGINTQITKWTASFLKDRSQVVNIEGTKSSPCPVSSGVPQGSVIGPS